MKSTTVLRTAVTVGAVATAALVGVAPASAAPAPVGLTVVYDASGSTVLKAPNTTVALPPTTLTAFLAPDGSFTGDLPLVPTTASFSALGILPTTATVSFIPVGKVTGSLITSGTTSRVVGSATYRIKLTHVKVAGLPTFQGNRCLSGPVTIPIATPDGQKFDITTGGTVEGTYTIGQFSNCGVTTAVINALVPGPGNTVSFTLSNGRITGQ